MIGSGDKYEIRLNDTTNSRQQFKTTNGQSSNDSELFNNPNFDTDTINEIWHRLKFVQSRHSPQVACVAKVSEEGTEERGACKIIINI